MRFILSLSLSLLFFGINAQSVDLDKFSPLLWDKMVDSPNELIPVNILLADQVDVRGMRMDFIKNKTSVEQRSIQVNTALRAKAAATQQPVVDMLYAEELIDRLSITPLWITNVIQARVMPATLRKLSRRSDIGYLEIILPKKRTHASEAVAAPMIPNGSEPGLRQMRANKLWDMGYTGAGSIVMTVDSGVDWLHPSLTGKYQGIYFDRNQSYTGDSPEGPTDCDGHGTRVTGNMVGLDRITNDTIGAAFGGRWIAGPLSLDTECPGVNASDIQNFQFALDPDNNSATTDDMVDVVNNSWGSDGGNCFNNSTIANAQNAMVAAGISVVWSAGNDGSGAMTVNLQGAINLDLVNSFSIGAVNASGNIAGFSSRGPSQCPGSGAIDIKPEVVAQGVNVRSSDLNGGYSSANGTSFSAPYVAGAVALLKEAFPSLSGEEINLALYFSATDLGDPGEDNDYGNGLINCLDAFNYLVNVGNIPANPNVSNDIVMIEVNDDLQICGDGTYAALATIENGGEDNLTSADIMIQYMVDGTPYVEEVINWTGNLEKGARTAVTIPQRTDLAGAYRLVVTAENPNNGVDSKPYNNRIETPIQVTAARVVNISTLGAASADPCASNPAFLVLDSPGAIGVKWYYTATGNILGGEGVIFESPALPSAFTVYAEVTYNAQGGILDIDDAPNTYVNQSNGGLVFDVLSPSHLNSTTVYSEDAGPKLFYVRDSRGQVVEQKILSVSVGENIINWDIDLPIGLNYTMTINGGGSFAVATVPSFPYAIGAAVFIKRSVFLESTQYEYFYNWDIDYVGGCGRIPHRIDFTGTTGGTTAGFDVVTVEPMINTPVMFTNTGSNGSGYFWDFGDGQTSIDENPEHVYVTDGTYLVAQTVISADGCGVSTYEMVTVELNTNTIELAEDEFINVFPNPTTGTVNVAFSFADAKEVGIQVTDVAGKLLLTQPVGAYQESSLELDLQKLGNGVYYLVFQMEAGNVVRRVVKID